MADLKQCDTCKKISPDAKGSFIANGWLEIIVSDRAARNNHRLPDEYLVCEACMSRGVILNDRGIKT